MSSQVKIVVTVPEDYADKIRQAIGDAGGGKVGNYAYCSFSVKGIGRFKPEDGASPAIGNIGVLEEVPEERIEVNCDSRDAQDVVGAIREAHPYETPAIDVYKIETL